MRKGTGPATMTLVDQLQAYWFVRLDRAIREREAQRSLDSGASRAPVTRPRISPSTSSSDTDPEVEMSVKAKFFIQSAEHTIGSDPTFMNGNVKMGAVCRGAANAAWSSATPSGQFQMYVSNPSAFKWFHDRIGKEVSISIVEAYTDPETHPFVEPDPIAKDSSWMKDTCGDCGLHRDIHTS